MILQPVDKSLNQGLRLIALVYLGIGVYVLLRRWTAPKAGHFYLFCLVSFIFYSFKFTGKLNQFDWTIYWSNVVAGMLQPAMFLHFVAELSGAQVFPAKAELDSAAGLSAGIAAAEHLGAAGDGSRTQRVAALEPGPDADGLRGGVFPDRNRSCSGTPISTPALRSCASR